MPISEPSILGTRWPSSHTTSGRTVSTSVIAKKTGATTSWMK